MAREARDRLLDIGPVCSNCKLRPQAAATHCFADWCTICDDSLYASRFTENVPSGSSDSDSDLEFESENSSPGPTLNRVGLFIEADAFVHGLVYVALSRVAEKQIRRAECIFWDEISMVSVPIVDALNRSLKRLMKIDRPFGGKVIIFLGDFRQLPPVDNTGDGTRLSEITAALPADSLLQHHPARVYLAQMNPEMDMIISKLLFGQVMPHCLWIEWQVNVTKFCVI
jgi:hypothetical protein